ncbi:hypothetical protein CLOP_g18932, partial [Closterium sp. NIES-67]
LATQKAYSLFDDQLQQGGLDHLSNGKQYAKYDCSWKKFAARRLQSGSVEPANGSNLHLRAFSVSDIPAY